jgi:hypothetical protein
LLRVAAIDRRKIGIMLVESSAKVAAAATLL